MNRHAARAVKIHTFNLDNGLTRRAKLLLCEEDGCWSKIAYETWEEAELAALRTMDDSRIRRSLMAYHCTFCELWHVGGDAPRIRNRVLTATRHGWSFGDWKAKLKMKSTSKQE